jgi:hypothetical protein
MNRVVVGVWVILASPLCMGASFIGFSSAADAGDAGYAVLSQKCDAAYPGSRMCSTAEYLNSVHPAKTFRSNSGAWIRSVRGGPSSDVSGALIGSDTAGDNCSGWFTAGSGFGGSTNVHVGLTVNGRGQFQPAACTARRAVACCK